MLPAIKQVGTLPTIITITGLRIPLKHKFVEEKIFFSLKFLSPRELFHILQGQALGDNSSLTTRQPNLPFDMEKEEKCIEQ